MQEVNKNNLCSSAHIAISQTHYPAHVGWPWTAVGGHSDMCVCMSIFGCIDFMGCGCDWSQPTICVCVCVCCRKIKVAMQSHPYFYRKPQWWTYFNNGIHLLELMQMQETQDISGKRIICSGEQDHLSHITWWSGWEKLGEGGDSNKFYLWGSQQNASTSEAENFQRFYRLFLNFEQDGKGGEPLSPSMQLLWWICSRKICFYHVYSNVYVNFMVKAFRLLSFSMCVFVCVDIFLCGWMVEVCRQVEKENAI